MSSTLNEIAYSVKNQLRAGHGSDDDSIDIEWVYYQVKIMRALLLKKEFDERKYVDENFLQEYCCQEIKCDIPECVIDGITVKSGARNLYVDIPETLSYLGASSLVYVGGPDWNSPIMPRSPIGGIYGDHTRFIGKVPFYYQVGDLIRLGNIPSGQIRICIRGVFENPVNICTAEEVYPVPDHLLHQLELLVIKHIISGPMLRTNSDKEKNNAAQE